MIQTSSAPCRSGGRREWQRVLSVGKWVETSYKMTLNLAPFQFIYFFFLLNRMCKLAELRNQLPISVITTNNELC